jgi:uncharacterized protein YhbP (UPF0306 family)
MSAPGSDRELRDDIRQMLEAHGTATLATTGGEGPWAAAVFYASDADLNLYFVSDPGTRHGRDLAAGGVAAAAIHADCGAWAEVRGLQLHGRVEVLEGAARAAPLALYLAKFEDVRRLVDRPDGGEEARIGERLRAAALYRLTPSWCRLIDNQRGFGFRRELSLG